MSNSNELSLVQGPPVEISSTRSSFAPTNIVEAMEFSKLLAQSNFIPKDFQGKPGDVLVAMQWGMEVGLAPLQALQNIAVINGRPTIWGDAALGIVQAHPEYVKHEEGIKGEGLKMIGWHTITRRGHAPHTVEFSVADAQKAGLWEKAGPWKNYPQRMLKLRARGWAIRDKFADALKGIITREEAQDMALAIDATPATAFVAEEPTINTEQAMEFYQAWKNIGKHVPDDVKAYLSEACGVTDSRKIPASLFEVALAWAKAPKAKTGEVVAQDQGPQSNMSEEDAEMIDQIKQAFDILGTPAKMQASLLNDYEGRLLELKAILDKDLNE